jgi:hypothetical protein
VAKIFQPGAEAPGITRKNAERAERRHAFFRAGHSQWRRCCESQQLQPSAHIDAGSVGSFANFSATRDGAFCSMFLRLRDNRLRALFIALKFFFAEAFTHLHQTQLELL